ncbi:MAG: PQQ-binding-like beta-propeller repeat protein [Planctomycetota bacterium]|nr:PQQ-binding-like beta-propeller repeat protein [Planctomycetota bacterium]
MKQQLLYCVGTALATCLMVCGSSKAADEWPQFRGPLSNGHADATDLPLTWSETENVRWKTAIPGTGHSSPVISGDQIWLTSAVEARLSDEQAKRRLAVIKNSRGLEIAGSISLRAICVSRNTGEVLQDIELARVDEPEPIHSLNSYASPTPILENDRLYCHFGTYGTIAVDTKSGRIVWTNSDHHVDYQNGSGASPALWQNHLIINFDGIDTQYVAAIDKRDGKTAWQTKRTGQMNEKAEFQKAYCTSAIIEGENGAQVISPGADWVYSYDPASGAELWKASYGTLGFSTVPLPVFGNGLVFISTSYMRPRLLAVRYDGSRAENGSLIEWQMDGQLPQKPSMLLIGDELYFINDTGIGMCLDARTGKEHWKERIAGQYSASPLFASGRIYLFSHEGKSIVIEPGREYKQLSENTLAGGFMASPAVAGNALFLRTGTHLYRVERD